MEKVGLSMNYKSFGIYTFRDIDKELTAKDEIPQNSELRYPNTANKSQRLKRYVDVFICNVYLI